MAIFNNLLLAIDLSSDSDQLLKRVYKMCLGNMSNVHVVHVLRYDAFELSLPIDKLGDDLLDDDQFRLRRQTVFKLNEILMNNGFSLTHEQIHIRRGEPANEIKQLAHDMEADLVIVGSHCKRGGWMSLPGATTNCVLQGIESDVMAVRV